ncbi:MAG: hypothetical protein WC897_04585 [Candidatus Gracilibacteria bacterium]
MNNLGTTSGNTDDDDSTKPHHFEDCPTYASDETLCEYYFDKYKRGNEKWSPLDFPFYQQHYQDKQTDRNLRLEALALRILASSRAGLENAILPMPEEIQRLVDNIDEWFQKTFLSYFGIPAPLSLKNVTHVTNENSEYADRTSGKSFIDIRTFYKNRNAFAHLVVHEAMHLSFNGFHQKRLEESLIEHFIEQMYKASPSPVFNYAPVSDQYDMWKRNLRSVINGLPEIEKRLTTYFLTQDIAPLADYIKTNLTPDVRSMIETNYYSSNIQLFLNDLAGVTA